MNVFDSLLDFAAKNSFKLWSGVPCSYLGGLINQVSSSHYFHYVPATNEGDSVAIAAGATIAGERGVAIFQNSGFGNAVNPITSLLLPFRLPILMVITMRGDQGLFKDAPQHRVMGAVTIPLLELMGIPWATVSNDSSEMEVIFQSALTTLCESSLPFALIVNPDMVAKERHNQYCASRQEFAARDANFAKAHVLDRDEVLAAISNSLDPEDAVVSTTGHLGRALYALKDRPSQFYMVGAMGCASSFALGIALACRDRRIIVLDGDGAALMRLGAMAVLGHQKPKNLVHVLFDNQMYESTGGQPSVSRTLDFCGVARSCGYPAVSQVGSLAELKSILENATDALHFVHVHVAASERPVTKRPSLTLEEYKMRFSRFLQGRQ